jgi:hypothetical protein
MKGSWQGNWTWGNSNRPMKNEGLTKFLGGKRPT